MRQVRKMANAKAISAYLIFNPAGKMVAKVQAHDSDSGVVRVDVWAAGQELQQGKAPGYGYDKFTAALSGLSIDGHVLGDNSKTDVPFPPGLDHYPADYKPASGFTLANRNPNGTYSYCAQIAGIDYLKELGYGVYQAI